jgi:hypothetical protein
VRHQRSDPRYLNFDAGLPFVLLDVGIDDAADIVILIFVVFQKAVVFLFVIIFDNDVFELVLVDDCHTGAFSFGLLDSFLFFVLARGGDDERGFVRDRLDDFFDLFALLVFVLAVLVVGFGWNGLRHNRFRLARTALLVERFRLE